MWRSSTSLCREKSVVLPGNRPHGRFRFPLFALRLPDQKEMRGGHFAATHVTCSDIEFADLGALDGQSVHEPLLVEDERDRVGFQASGIDVSRYARFEDGD